MPKPSRSFSFTSAVPVSWVSRKCQSVGGYTYQTLIAARDQTRTHAVCRIAKTVGKNRRLIRDAAAGGVFQTTNAILRRRKFLRKLRRIRHVLVQKGEPILDRFRGDVFVTPFGVVAIVFRTPVEAKCLGHVPASFFVLGETHGIGQQWLGGPQLTLQALIKLERLDRVLPFIRCRRHLLHRNAFLFDGLERSHRQGGGEKCGEEQQ